MLELEGKRKISHIFPQVKGLNNNKNFPFTKAPENILLKAKYAFQTKYISYWGFRKDEMGLYNLWINLVICSSRQNISYEEIVICIAKTTMKIA